MSSSNGADRAAAVEATVIVSSKKLGGGSSSTAGGGTGPSGGGETPPPGTFLRKQPSSDAKNAEATPSPANVGGNGMFVEDFPLNITDPAATSVDAIDGSNCKWDVEYKYTGNVLRDSDGQKTQFTPNGAGKMVATMRKPPVAAPTSSQAGDANNGDGVSVNISAATAGDVVGTVTYTGDFACGKRHGTGKLSVDVAKKRFTLQCEWNDDIPDLVGQPCRMDEGKDRYLGMLSIVSRALSKEQYNGLCWPLQIRLLPDATGEIFDGSTQRRYCGEWQCGQRHGFGVDQDASGNVVYIGGFVDDCREGAGALFNNPNGTTLSGTWKDGQLTGQGSMHLQRRHTIVADGWTDNSNGFDEGTLVNRRSISGIWEPLFLSFDANLSNLASQFAQRESPIRARGRFDAAEAILGEVETVLCSGELQALLTVFQRCMYFRYGSCGSKRERGGGGARGGRAKEHVGSWCFVSGVPHLCIHSSRGRTLDKASAAAAANDAASYVFSVRLRILSLVAAHPKSVDLNLTRHVLQLVWNHVFAAVGPLLMQMFAEASPDVDAAWFVATGRAAGMPLDLFVGKPVGESAEDAASRQAAGKAAAVAIGESLVLPRGVTPSSFSGTAGTIVQFARADRSGAPGADDATLKSQVRGVIDVIKSAMMACGLTQYLISSTNPESSVQEILTMPEEGSADEATLHRALMWAALEAPRYAFHDASSVSAPLRGTPFAVGVLLLELLTSCDPHFPVTGLSGPIFEDMSAANTFGDDYTADDATAVRALRLLLSAIRIATSTTHRALQIVAQPKTSESSKAKLSLLVYPTDLVVRDCRTLLLNDLIIAKFGDNASFNGSSSFIQGQGQLQPPLSDAALQSSPGPRFPYETLTAGSPGISMPTFGPANLSTALLGHGHPELSPAAAQVAENEEFYGFILWMLDVVGSLLDGLTLSPGLPASCGAAWSSYAESIGGKLCSTSPEATSPRAAGSPTRSSKVPGDPFDMLYQQRTHSDQEILGSERTISQLRLTQQFLAQIGIKMIMEPAVIDDNEPLLLATSCASSKNDSSTPVKRSDTAEALEFASPDGSSFGSRPFEYVSIRFDRLVVPPHAVGSDVAEPVTGPTLPDAGMKAVSAEWRRCVHAINHHHTSNICKKK